MSVRRETRCLCRDYRYGSLPLQLFFSTADGARLEDLTLEFPPRYYRAAFTPTCQKCLFVRKYFGR